MTAGVAAFGIGASWAIGEMADNGYNNGAEAVVYAEENGYTNVELVDTDTLTFFSGCDDSDAVKYEMTATAPNGAQANVIACGGVWTALTLRRG